MIRDISIKLLLVGSFLISGLIPTMIVSLIGFSTAKTELRVQAFSHLESVRNIKKEQVYNFFSERHNNLSVFAKNPYIISAYKELYRSFSLCGGTESRQFKGHLNQIFDAPPMYNIVHDRHFPYFKHLVSQYSYYDLFLMDPAHGDTLFTVRKESDFGIRIGEMSSSLRDVWLEARQRGGISLSDTKPYPPSDNAPAQFLAAPIRENAEIIGILAVQISIDSIDNIMKERSGLWETGETYLVGPDKKMRSDSSLDRANHSVHASFYGSVEQNGVDTTSSRLALQGRTGTHVALNYRGREVLSAYTPVNAGELKWAIIAEVEKQEIERRISHALNTKIIFLFIVSAAILLLLSMIISIFISKGIGNTIGQLDKMIKDVLKGELSNRGDPDSVGVDFKGVVHSANQLIGAFEVQSEEKQKLEEHLQLTEKLKAIGTLAGGIAHDFNNILTAMFAYCHIVMSDLPEGSESWENMTEIQAAIRRATDLVDQILTFGRHEKAEKQAVEIGSLISATVKLLKATLPKNIGISLNISQEPLSIQAKASQLNQVLMNLTTNSIHAMREKGGLLDISVKKVVNNGKELPHSPKGNYCKIEIADKGHGISRHIRERIFEPFFTTKPSDQGSGMGLAIVQGIVLNYGGEIDLKSIPGKGTVIKVYFPLVETPLALELKTPRDLEAKRSGQHILFVDDEPQICRSESSILKSLDYKVTTFTDSRNAASFFTEHKDSFDLVITDIDMPYLNGIELTQKIRRVQPDIPVILITGHSRYYRLAEKKMMGAKAITRIFKKPFEKDQLLAIIAEVSAKKADH